MQNELETCTFSNSTTVLLDVDLSNTTTLNNLFLHHYFNHDIREEIEFGNFEMLGLGLNE